MAKLHNKTDYVIHIVLKMAHRVIKFNQKAGLKSYIDMKTELRKRQKMTFRKVFMRWWIIQFLVKLPKIRENIEISNL